MKIGEKKEEKNNIYIWMSPECWKRMESVSIEHLAASVLQWNLYVFYA